MSDTNTNTVTGYKYRFNIIIKFNKHFIFQFFYRNILVVRLWCYKAVMQWCCDAVRLWGCEAVRLWGCEAVRLWGYKDVMQWGYKTVMQWGYKDVMQWGYKDVMQWGCEAVRLWHRVWKSKDKKRKLVYVIFKNTLLQFVKIQIMFWTYY